MGTGRVHRGSLIPLQAFDDVPLQPGAPAGLGAPPIASKNAILERRNRFIKRSMDVVLGAGGLLCALPLILLGVLLVKLVSRGPAFYSQVREGFHGEDIKVWKLRTMFDQSEQWLEQHFAADPAAREEWEERFKLRDDPRVLPLLGSCLRRFSIDELPQFWSVLKGDMSLVGPRPFPAYHLESFPPAFRLLRQQVRPGLTGLWQVTVRSRGGIRQQQFYDTNYIRHWSVWMDLSILARTFIAVATSRGAC